MSKNITRTLARVTFYTVALVLLAWTASLTYAFVASALPTMPWYVPLLSLIVFDAGMIAWMFVFLNYAEGAVQRSVALIACTVDLIGVGLMVIAEILLGGQSWAVAPEHLAEYAIWGIGVWTVLNVIAVVAFHLASPEAITKQRIQDEKDAIMDAALKDLQSRRIADGGRLAESISATLFRDLQAELFADGEQPALTSPVRQNGHIKDDMPTRPTPAGVEPSQAAAPAHEVALEVPETTRPTR